MNLLINLKPNSASLEISQNGRMLDSETFSYYHDLDDKLISYIDKLLKRNSIDITVVKAYKIVEGMGENSTSAKIAQAVVEGLKS
jgi:hypothetical protein